MSNTKGSLGKRIVSQAPLLTIVGLGVAWIAIFYLIPIAGSSIAFLEYKIYKPIWEAPWVGLDNFVEFISDENFPGVLINTLGISFLKLVFGFPIPIILAIVLTEVRFTGFRRVIQTITYLPHFLSWAVLGGIMTVWLGEGGFLTNLMAQAGLVPDTSNVLARPDLFWTIAVASDVWKEAGFNAIIFFAAIAGIDPQLYEAAELDGASRWERIRLITIPSILPTIVVMLVLNLGYLMNANFDQIMILKNQLNLPTSNVLDLYVYITGVQSGRFSYATAIGLFRSLVSLAFLLLANWMSRRFTGHSLY